MTICVRQVVSTFHDARTMAPAERPVTKTNHEPIARQLTDERRDHGNLWVRKSIADLKAEAADTSGEGLKRTLTGTT